MINYAQWQDGAAFRAFTHVPMGDALKSAIRAVDPSLKPDAMHGQRLITLLFTDVFPALGAGIA